MFNNNNVQNEDFSIDNIQNMIDLHLHLDGAISIESAKKLAELQNIEIPNSDVELEKLMRVSPDCSDLNEFLEKFEFPCSLIQTKEGLTGAVKNLLDELDLEGVTYAEIRFAPQKSTNQGLTQEQAVQAAIDGMKESKVKCNLILCGMRDKDNKDANLDTVDVAAKYLGQGVCAVDLAGAEALFPTKDFEYMFKYAQEKDVSYTIHAGEADGPASIRTACSFGAKRIGHGIMAKDDDALLSELADLKIPLEMCPTSNINTAVFKNISEYPIRKFLDAGVCVTINTDDPSIEGTTIKGEYKKLINAFGLTKDEVKQLLINSANSAFLNDDEKSQLVESINKEFDN